jgi:hypothetical protein
LRPTFSFFIHHSSFFISLRITTVPFQALLRLIDYMELLIFIIAKTIKPLIMKSTFKAIAKAIAAPSRKLSFLFVLLATLLVVSCGRGKKIPVDEARAREQVIPVKLGIAYQDSFVSARNQLARLLNDSSFLNRKFNLPNAETFNRDAIALLLNAEGPGGLAAGIRVYLGTDEKGLLRIVLVPVDKDGKDIIGPLLANRTALNIPGVSSAYAQGDDGQVVENGQVCPPCQIGR